MLYILTDSGPSGSGVFPMGFAHLVGRGTEEGDLFSAISATYSARSKNDIKKKTKIVIHSVLLPDSEDFGL